MAEKSRFVAKIGYLPDNATPSEWIFAFAAAVTATSPRLVLPCDDSALRLVMMLAVSPPPAMNPAMQLTPRARLRSDQIPRRSPRRIGASCLSTTTRRSESRSPQSCENWATRCDSPPTALQLAEQWQPEFVVLDVHMPKLNGYDLARRLRAKFPPATMQLVMMSGTALDQTTLAGAKSASFDHCIDKLSAVVSLNQLLRGGTTKRSTR
jgi:CheY-like chemotaxis protein